MDEKCRIEIRPISGYAGNPDSKKLGLWDNETDWFMANKSGTALLEFRSRKAAMKAHDKICRHDAEPYFAAMDEMEQA